MDNQNGFRSNRISAASISSDDGNSVSFRTLLKYFELHKTQYKQDELRTMLQFFNEEEEYVHQLEILEVQRDELKLLQIPDCDLYNIFGCTSEIRAIHKYHLPTYAMQFNVRSIEEVLQYFLSNKKKLRWYILDNFKKSQKKLLGRQAIERRFYSRDIVRNLGLPKKRIEEYMKFCQGLKMNLEDSMIVYNSLEMFKHIYLQIEYALSLAAIQNLSQYVCINCDVLYIDRFQIAVDHGQPSSYKVHCFDKVIIITSTLPNSSNQMQRIDYYIDNTKIQYSHGAAVQEDLSFEFTEYLENNKKRVYTLTAENTKIKLNWTDAIQNILYKQLIEEKYKVKTP